MVGITPSTSQLVVMRVQSEGGMRSDANPFQSFLQRDFFGESMQ